MYDYSYTYILEKSAWSTSLPNICNQQEIWFWNTTDMISIAIENCSVTKIGDIYEKIHLTEMRVSLLIF